MEAETSLADRYETARLEGVRRIQDRWSYLRPLTQGLLTSSGFYSDRGQRLEAEAGIGRRNEKDVDYLEYLVGTLGLCVAAKVPFRHEKDAPIPSEALNREVVACCEELVFFPDWRDPEFLRLALKAVATHNEASLLTMVGPAQPKSVALGCVGVVLRVGLLLLAPVALTAGLIAVSDRNALGAAIAFYVVGAGAVAAASLRREGKGEDRTAQEKAHFAWQSLRLDGMGVLGAGASAALQRMAVDGVKVPVVALDLCEALQHHTLQAGAATGLDSHVR